MSTILVIDDDETFRNVLAKTLEKQGLEVMQAATGAQGVQLARTDAPDLILCDVELGGVGGNLVLYAVRRDPQLAHIPFVLMSGHGLGGDIALPGTERGADGFLAKPFSPAKLTATIDACLIRKQEKPAKADWVTGGFRAEAGGDSTTGLLQPLKRVLELTRLLGTRPQEPKAIMELAGQVHHAAAGLLRRIENCLCCAEIERLASDWQRIGALQEYRTGARSVIESAAREKARLADRTADLVLMLEETPVAISPDRLKKIVEELLDNAFTFSQPASSVQVTTVTDSGHVVLSISDRGSGMTAEQIARGGVPISLDQVLLTQHGSGLGLSIAQRLVELHKGTLTIQVGPGHGTTVTVNLPRPLPA